MELQKKIYNFILDFWKLVKKYTPPPKQEDQKAWDTLVNESTELVHKHETGTREDKFFRELVFVWFDYIGGRRWD